MSNKSNEKSILFSRSEPGNEDDVWDDRALIKAYNKSIRMVKKAIDNKLKIDDAENKEKEQENIEDFESCTEEDEEEEEEIEYGEDADNEETDIEYYKPVNKNWKEGDRCFAVYSADGLIYEATIIKILDEESRIKCTIQYLHYLNEEDKYVDELYDHKKDIENVVIEESKIHLEETSKGNKSVKIEPSQSKNSNDKFKRNLSSKITELTDFKKISLSMPPPPPPPAAVFKLFKSQNDNEQVNEEDALYTMLMSWYMSGYHTGYYFGSIKNKNQ